MGTVLRAQPEPEKPYDDGSESTLNHDRAAELTRDLPELSKLPLNVDIFDSVDEHRHRYAAE